ncbi:hypothetical protein NW765_011465 [Fusarium oxysporum]|nr:hypothetical protein NW765_011465 [Fusarium oxysporum]
MEPPNRIRDRRSRRLGKERATSSDQSDNSGPSQDWRANVEKEYLPIFLRFMGRASSSLVECRMPHTNISGEIGTTIGAGTSFRVFPIDSPNASASSRLLSNMVMKAVHQATSLPSWEERFNSLLTEIRVLTARPIKSHPNIVQLAELAWTETLVPKGLYYPSLILEGAEFGNLEFFQQPSVFSLLFHTKLSLCLDVAEGLEFLHACGIIHGDVKPANVLLFHGHDGSGILRAKISDFSHSLFECDAENGMLSWLGRSRPWSAPETQSQTAQDVALANRSDIFSFGLLVLFIMLEDPDLFFQVFNNIQLNDDEPYLAHAMELMVHHDKDVDLLLLQEIFTQSLPVTATDRGSSLAEIIVSVDQGMVSRGREPRHHANIPVKLTWSLKEMSNVINVNEVCIAQSIYSPAVQRQIFNALSYECQRGTDKEDVLEAILQYGICFINKFGNRPSADKECLETGLQFIAIAAKLGSHRAMPILPLLHESYGFSFPQLDFQAKEAGTQENDPSYDIKTCILKGCSTGSLIALDYSFNKAMEDLCLRAFQGSRRMLSGLTLDSMPFDFDFSDPIALQMQLLSLARKYGFYAVIDGNGNTPLHFAAANNLPEIVRVLLDSGVPVDAANRRGETALLHSMMTSSVDTTIILLARDADITLRSKSLGTPLHHISGFRGLKLQQVISSIKHKLVPQEVDLMIEEYESVPWHYYICLSPGTPLHWALNRKNTDSARFLLENGASPLLKNSRGCSPLYYALHNNMIQFLELFTSPDTPWSLPVRENLSNQAVEYAEVLLAQQRFQLALINGPDYPQARRSTMELLCSVSCVDIKHLLLWFAVDRGYLEAVHTILENGPKLIDTVVPGSETIPCLLRSIQRGDRAMFDLLMKYKPNTNAHFDTISFTYLHALCGVAIPEEARIYYATELIAAGSDVNAVNAIGISPLVFALIHGQTEYAKTLLGAGAKYDQTSKSGFTMFGDLIRASFPGRNNGIEFYLQEIRSPIDPSFIVHGGRNLTALNLASSIPDLDKGVLMRLLQKSLFVRSSA